MISGALMAQVEARMVGRDNRNYHAIVGQGDATRRTVVGQSGATRDLINRRMEDFDTTAQQLRSGQSDISRDIYEQGLDNRLEFDSLRGFIGDQTNQLGSQFSGINQNINDVYQQGANIGSTLDYEFANLNNNMTGVNNSLSDLDNTVGQGFGNVSNQVSTGFSDLNTSVNDGLMAASDERQAGFTGLADQIGTGFTGQAEYLNNMSSNILGGQQQLTQRLEDTGNRLDTYYGGLSEGQAGLMDRVGGVQTGLTDLSREYEDDVALANQDRAAIAQGLASSTTALREDLGNVAGSLGENQSRLMSQVAGSNSLLNQNRAQVDDLSQSVQGGFREQSAQTQVQQQNFAQNINRVRGLLQETGESLDQQTRQQYSELVASFDQNGQLIQRSIDNQGRTVQRELGEQNNLVIDKFDQTGQRVDNVNLNVDQMLQQAAAFEQQITGQVNNLGSDVQSGFSQTSADLSGVQSNLAGQQAALQNEVASGFDRNRADLNAAFDAQGNLIEQSVDAQGNLVLRSLDAQGNVISQRIDQTGQIIDQTSAGISGLESSLANQQAALQDTFNAGFDRNRAELDAAFDAQGNLIRQSVDAQGNTILRSLDAQGNVISQRIDQTGQLVDQTRSNVGDIVAQSTSELGEDIGRQFRANEGLMSDEFAQTRQSIDQTRNAFISDNQRQTMQVMQGFDEQAGTMDLQTRDLAKLGSQMSGLDTSMRQEFFQIGNAFDDTGNLIRNSVDQQGNTLSRAIDQNGNLLIRQFDATGRNIGDRVVNIDRALARLADLPVRPGANVNMSRRTQPLQQVPGEPVAAGGFMSPYTQTR